ncbi:MAG: cupin domain-containing protein [Pseudomonadota bacterium]
MNLKSQEFVYLISTLKTDWNLTFNPRLCAAIEKRGFRVYLPQRDTDQRGTANEIFQRNISAIVDSHAVLFVGRNETHNCCAEAGFAFGLGKPVLALCEADHEIPVMTRGMPAHTERVSSLDRIPEYLDGLALALQRAFKKPRLSKGMSARDLVKLLGLKPLPNEGGFYNEIYRSQGKIGRDSLADYPGDRSYLTSIYYLVTPEAFSSLHRVRSAEIFHFYLGDTVEMVQIDTAGSLKSLRLGPDVMNGEVSQAVVSAGAWQGTRLVEGGDWALLGCTVAPGFEFEDFEAGTFEDLSRLFPKHADTLRRYTHR